MGCKLLIGAEELFAASTTHLDAVGLGVCVLAGKRTLGACLTKHVVLKVSELLAPLGFGLDDLQLVGNCDLPSRQTLGGPQNGNRGNHHRRGRASCDDRPSLS